MTWHLLLPEGNKRCGSLQTREGGGSFTQNQRDETLDTQLRKVEDVYPVMHIHIWVVRESAGQYGTHLSETVKQSNLGHSFQLLIMTLFWILEFRCTWEWHRRYKVSEHFDINQPLPPFTTSIPFVFPIYNSTGKQQQFLPIFWRDPTPLPLSMYFKHPVNFTFDAILLVESENLCR